MRAIQCGKPDGPYNTLSEVKSLYLAKYFFGIDAMHEHLMGLGCPFGA
jgi:hypothetical protein